MNLKWNVFLHSINKDKIEIMNIFNHGGFKIEVEELLEKYRDKGEFAEKLRTSLMYYFWCKSEYEVIISPWVGGRNEGRKVDIYKQVIINWEIFLDYVWSQRERAGIKTIGIDIEDDDEIW